MKGLMLCMIMLLVFNAEIGGSDEQEQTKIRERPRVLCGRILADARMLYCFSSGEAQKRDSGSPLINSLYPQNEVRTSDMPWPSMVRARRSQALALERAKREPGLVDECCLKPCFVSELLNYC